MKLWWCMDCKVHVELSKHGRCESCESEAVYLESSPKPTQAPLVEPALMNASLPA